MTSEDSRILSEEEQKLVQAGAEFLSALEQDESLGTDPTTIIELMLDANRKRYERIIPLLESADLTLEEVGLENEFFPSVTAISKEDTENKPSGNVKQSFTITEAQLQLNREGLILATVVLILIGLLLISLSYTPIEPSNKPRPKTNSNQEPIRSGSDPRNEDPEFTHDFSLPGGPRPRIPKSEQGPK